MESQSETSQTVSALKLPVLKTREYDLWSMRMEQYLTFTDHALWEVIVNGDSVSPVASASAGAEGPIPPKTAEQKLARKNELKAKSTLMLAIPDEHLLKFHACKDAKSLWEAIKNRFGGNKESKKMQKTILKQNYENFAASSQEGLDKTYDRFQKLISQLEIHGEVISQEDANLKLLRSLPSAWNNIALIMRNKSNLDTLSMDDLYNNLKVTNETVNTAHNVFAASSKNQASTTSYADDVMFSFFSNQSNASQLNNEDLEQIDADDLEEIDLKWQVAMLTMRVKRFIKKTGMKLDLNDKETVGFDRTNVECYNYHKRGQFAKECRAPRNQGNRNRDAPRRNAPVDTSTTNALVVQDGIGVQTLSHNKVAKDKTGLGYDSQINESELNNVHKNKSEVIHSVFNSRESDVDDNPINDKFKTGKGFHAVPPLYIGNYIPLRPDLSFSRLDESVFKSAVRKTTTSVPKTETSISKTSKDIVEKPKIVRPKKPVLNNKGRVTGQREIRPVWNNAQRVNHQNKLTHPHPKRNFVPTAVATKSGQVPVNAAKQSSPRAATSISTARPVNTVAPKPKVNNVTTVGPKAVVSTAEGNGENVVKSSACWIWRPTGNGNPQYALQDQGIFDNGCSRHMTRNKSYLTNYQEIDGGFVAFGGNAKGGKITRKGKIKTRKLDFEDVYFVKEHKFNLFSVSQMCDKKNNVLFTDTECVVLSPDFKLPDESQVLLKVPRNNNMYSFDLKNVVPLGGLTCLFAKATLDESNLWHRRLGHINFKTMNKLVRGNLVRDHKVKTIRCDNGTEFKNRIMNEFCEMKGIRREFSVARTPQQNGVAERKNKTLIEAARTMLADSKLPTTFWAEVVNTACYVQNRVLVIKPHNKTPYELFLGRKPALSFMRPFGCPVTILNTLDHLGKFDGKSDDGFFVGYSINSKAFRVFNTRTRFIEENLHINFLENKPNVAGTGPNWMFDIDTLTMSMNYQPVSAGNQTNSNAGTKANIDVGQAGKKTVPGPQYVLLPFFTFDSQGSKSSEDEVVNDAGQKNRVLDPAKVGDKNGQEKDVIDQEEALRKQFKQEFERLSGQWKATNTNNTNRLNTVSSSINAVSSSFTIVDPGRERA
ncbi:ribonuclease H-like domain-containing protein [Tanacetum coccineum]